MNFHEGTITVSKEALITKVRENLAAHKMEYETAMAGYRTAFTKKLEDMLERMRKGEAVSRHEPLAVAKPKSHENDYSVVLAMLTMSVSDQVTITQSQFRMFVLDEWGWKGDFAVSTASYR